MDVRPIRRVYFRASIAASLMAMSVACNKSSSSGGRESAEVPAGMEFTGVRPIAGKPGDELELTGNNLSGSVASSLNFGAVSAPITVTSTTTAKFVVPDGLGLGLKQATASAGGTEAGKLAIVATSATNSLPIIISDRSQVCSDVTYINASGDQDTGTRDCSAGGGGSTEPVPTPDAYNVRKGVTVSGVAGKLITGCQNRVNKNIFEMRGGSSFAFARVTNIRAGGRIFKLSGIVGNRDLLVLGRIGIKPVGASHPLPPGNVAEVANLYISNPTVMDDSTDVERGYSVTYIPDNNLDEIAIRSVTSATTVAASGANCVDGVGPDCFDIVAWDNIPDPWDTIDDLNGDDPSGVRAYSPPYSGPDEPFLGNLCGFMDGTSAPSGSIVSWKDNTLNNSGQADSCASNPGNCGIKDLLTGLTWFKGDGAVKNWYEAAYYCGSLTLSGKSWRLPTQKELMVAYVNTIRNTVGTGTVQDYNRSWWSSTTDSTNPLNGWTVNLATGATASLLKTTSPAVAKALCVRSE